MAVQRPDSSPVSLVLPRVARGDKTAVSECLERYGRLVLGMARKWLGPSGTDAEDAVQDVFIELWKQAGRYDPELCSELGFVALITRRKLIDRYRRRKCRPREEGLIDLIPQPATNAANAWEIEDQLAPVRAVLKELPEEQRRVLLLAVSEGQTHSEIAELTGLPLGTIKTYIRRGLLFVRERLASNNKGGPK
jgi:RNA polymerase sigma factor (sigma-70 family)